MGCIQCLWVLSLSFAVLQMCVCVCGVWTDIVCKHKAHFLSSVHSAQLFCLHCTLACSVIKLTYLHQAPFFALASTDPPDEGDRSQHHRNVAIKILNNFEECMSNYLTPSWSNYGLQCHKRMIKQRLFFSLYL